MHVIESDMLRIPLLVWAAASIALAQTGSARSPESQLVEALVKKLYPDSKRMATMKLPEVFAALGVKPGSAIADVGAGSGEFSVLLSHLVGPAGRVYAIDTDEKNAVRPFRKAVRKDRLRNVEVIRGDIDNPRLAARSIDGVMIIDSYHEMVRHQAMLTRIREALRPGGRLVIVDPLAVKTRNRPRQIQTDNHVLAPDLVEEELREAGFEVVDRRDHFIDDPDSERTQWIIAAQPR